MSGGMVGADIEALRLLADKFDEGSDKLETIVTTVESVVPQQDGWSGPDAEGFRQEWTGNHLVRLRETAAALSEVAGKVRSNADAQEETSNDYSGIGGGPGGTDVAGASDSGFNWDGLGLAGMLGAKGVGFGLAAWKAIKTGSALTSLVSATRLGDAAKIADATADVYRGAGGLVGRTAAGLGLAEDFGLIGKMSGWVGLASSAGTIARVAGTAGGVFGVVGGLNQMFNTQYDGVRGGVDRVMGGLSVVGGAGGIAIALGGAAMLGPVGVGIAVGAGVVAGAWALGNLVYDNWDSISGAVSGAADWVGGGISAGWNAAGDAVGNMADAAGDAVSDVGDAVGDGLSAAGDFVGGLFS
ncbi:WXG100 family type VII secretion target [Promicromonospora sp. NPDC090134]|uniref:WXG100 family type VII secretion target n=1 Tax=Promicromonospora sp. NPDC090134 TaxID=3364408 RepID=UPI00381F7CA8